MSLPTTMINSLGIVLALIEVMALAGCSQFYQGATVAANLPVTTADNAITPLSKTITLIQGQTVFVPQLQMNVTFDKVINDSRCAPNTQCIWAGNASVRLTVMQTYGRPQSVVLSTGDVRAPLTDYVDMGESRLRLMALTPAGDTATTLTLAIDAR